MERRTKIGILLRLTGAALLAVAVVAGKAMPAPGITAPDYLLALIAFAAASAGSALLIVGPVLRDPVPLSSRWASPRPFDRR